MPPTLLRRASVPLVLAATAALAGCGPQAARAFAIVLEEPPAIECTPKLGSGGIDFQSFFSYLVQAPKSWQAQYESGLLRPSGGSLHLVAGDGGSLAFFADLQQSQYYQWNSVVFRGDAHDDYVDASSVISHDGDKGYPVAGCGQLIDVKSELLATIDGGSIDGRIRRTEIVYFSDGERSCGASIECARSIALTGAQE